jgi:membrane-associated protein
VEVFKVVIDFILHIDTHLGALIATYGTLTYIFLFAILFAETGFVFTPFLPGDSLIFAAGAFAAIGSFNVVVLIFLFWCAAFLGDTTNYWIGHFFGQKIIDNPHFPINQKHIDKTQKFYDKHGGKTIFLARFIPIIRTFAPFVAGIGKMEYKKFISFNATGGLTWVCAFTLLGYFFGNLPGVRTNFSFVIIAIIVLSLTPIFIEFIKSKLKE